MCIVDQLCRTSIYDVTPVCTVLNYRANQFLSTSVSREMVERMHKRC
jgi:hypothetical protein